MKKTKVEIPPDYEVVTSGICKKGDSYLNAHLFNLGTVLWHSAETEVIGKKSSEFFLLIRKTV